MSIKVSKNYIGHNGIGTKKTQIRFVKTVSGSLMITMVDAKNLEFYSSTWLSMHQAKMMHTELGKILKDE